MGKTFDGNLTGRWSVYEGYATGPREQYTRSDLIPAPTPTIPTDAECLRNPKVQALVREIERYMPILGEAVESHGMGDKFGIATCNALRHALAAFEEDRTS